MQNAPGLKILIPMLLGILIGWWTSVEPVIWFFLLVFCTILLNFSSGLFFDICVMVCFIIVGGLRLEIKENWQTGHHIARFSPVSDHQVGLEGVICSPVDEKTNRYMFTLDADSVFIQEKHFYATGNVLVSLYDKNTNIRYGDRIVLTGELEQPPSVRNPRGFDYKKYLASQNIHMLATADRILVLERDQGNLFLQSIVYPARRYVIDVIEKTLNGQSQAILKALLVGARGEIDPELKQAFANVGVIHVLAVSGLHVGFVLLVLMTVFKLVNISQIPRTWIVVIGLIFYALMTGQKPPVVRATIMAIVVLFGTVLQRPVTIINSLSIAAFIILMINPLELFQAGFQLSFAAVLGIILIYEQLQKSWEQLRQKWQENGSPGRIFLIDLFFVSLAAQLATAPFTAYYFGKIPLLSLIANLLMVPIVGLIVAIGYVTIVFSLIYFPIAHIYAQTNWLLLTGSTRFVSWAAELPFAFFRVSQPTIEMMFLYYNFLFIVIFWQNEKIKRKSIVIFLIFLNIMVYRSIAFHKQGLFVTFLDVNHGDAIFCTTPNGRNLLIDAGDCNDHIDYGTRVVVPYLQRHGIDHIHNLVITHAHSDHIGGVPAVINACKIDRIIRTKTGSEMFFSRKVDSLAAIYNIRLHTVDSGDTLDLDKDLFCMILHPLDLKITDISKDDLNNQSIVMKMCYGSTSFLFSGDAEKEAEKYILRYQDILNSNVVKVGHHGSPTSSSKAFIRYTRPDHAVVSVGRSNRFDLPSDLTLSAWKQIGSTVLRTDVEGAIQFYSDGISLTMLD